MSNKKNYYNYQFTSEEAKPCPCCGESDIRDISARSEPTHNVVCGKIICINCGLTANASIGGLESALERWNRREYSPTNPTENGGS